MANPKFWSSATLRRWQTNTSAPPIMRNATAYGVSPRLRLDIVLNDLVAAAYTQGRVYIKSDGTPWRPIVHIRDIVGAALAALEAPREAVHNQIFNVGQTEENYRIRELAAIVAETVPGSRVEYAPEGGPDLRCYRVNCEKIRRLLPAFRPQWTARKGAQELYDAYRAAGLTREDMECWPLHPPQADSAPAESGAIGCFLALERDSAPEQRWVPDGLLLE